MSKKPLNRACLLKILTGLVGVLEVSSLIPLPAFAQINPLLNPYTTLNSNIITPSATGVDPYLQRTAIPGGTVTSSSGEVYNSDGTFVNPSTTVITAT